VPGERQLGRRGEDVCSRRTGTRRWQIDENRLAVTQFGGDALLIRRSDEARVDDAERVAEVTCGVGEDAQHAHVDGHGPMLRRAFDRVGRA